MQREAETPAWAKTGELFWCSWADTSPVAMRRFGTPVGQALWLDEWYHRLHSEELVETMADLGTSLAVTHFFDGFGLVFERAQMERTRDLCDLCRAHGIRVIGRIELRRLSRETFPLERPEAGDWVSRAATGGPRTAAHYSCWQPCLANRQFREYLGVACRIGVTEVGLSGFLFDGIQARGCKCEACAARFREWLQARHPNPRDRFGLASFARVQPPPPGLPGPIHDPLAQEWIRFSCEQLTQAIGQLAELARAHDPDALVMAEAGIPRYANWRAARSVDPFALGKHLDLMLCEAGDYPRRDGDFIVSAARTHKLARACGYRAATNPRPNARARADVASDPDTIQLSVLESVAFGGVPGTNWALEPVGGGAGVAIDRRLSAEVLAESQRFVRDHAELYRGAQTLANVALVCSTDSLAFDAEAALSSLEGMEEILLRGHYLFDLLFTDDLATLPQYDAALLANQRSLSDDVCSQFLAFVAAGGAALIAGEAGRYDENMRQRSASPLEPLRGSSGAVWLDGRPEVAQTQSPPAFRVARPEGFDQVVQSLAALLGDRRPVQVSAPEEVFVEGCRLPDGRRTLHFVNYATDRPVADAAARFAEPFTSATWFTPEEREPLGLRQGSSSGEVTLPDWQTYGVVVLT